MSENDKVPPAEIAAMFEQFLRDAARVDDERERQELAEKRQRDREWLTRQPEAVEEPKRSPWEALFDVTDVAESPIESQLLRAIILRGATRSAHGEKHLAEIGTARLYAQLPIGPYRVDIALTDGPARLVIECDGRAFHSTEAQLLSDRRRDRELMLMGWRVIRYSGSEIHKSADACAAEALWIFDVIRGVR